MFQIFENLGLPSRHDWFCDSGAKDNTTKIWWEGVSVSILTVFLKVWVKTQKDSQALFLTWADEPKPKGKVLVIWWWLQSRWQLMDWLTLIYNRAAAGAYIYMVWEKLCNAAFPSSDHQLYPSETHLEFILSKTLQQTISVLLLFRWTQMSASQWPLFCSHMVPCKLQLTAWETTHSTLEQQPTVWITLSTGCVLSKGEKLL